MNRLGTETLLIVAGEYIAAGELGESLAALLVTCAASRTEQPESATFALGVGPPDGWPLLRGRLSAGARAVVWFEHLLDPADYARAAAVFPSADFLHGEFGLRTLRRLLIGQGISQETAAVDDAGADVLFELKGAYLQQLVSGYREFVETRPESEPALSAAWKEYLHRVEGSAGTYEFVGLSEAARRAKSLFGIIPAPEENEELAAEIMTLAINAAVDSHRQLLATRMPERIAHDVRHRALLLATDPALGQQLRLALTHSRLEALLHEDPSSFYAVAKAVQPDVLVIAQELDRFDGFDIAAQLRSDPSFAALPLVAVLEDTSEATRTRAANCGVDAWLLRPFSAENALATVRALLVRLEAQVDLGGRDPVTGLYSYRALQDRMDLELQRARRTGELVALMLIHIESGGGNMHPRQRLCALARTVEATFRRSDVLARHNDHTIAAVLPSSEPRVILSLIDRLLEAADPSLQLQISASIAEGAATPQLMIADAEHRLMAALEGNPTASVGRCVAAEDVERQARSQAPRVLLVDNDEAILSLLRFFCAREGLVTDEARDGLAAIEYLEQAARTQTLPDLVVMEAYLPGVDGFSVLRKIQSDFGGRVAVMMLTIQRNEERIAKAFKLGAADFVAKPFSVPEVMARIKNILLRSGAL